MLRFFICLCIPIILTSCFGFGKDDGSERGLINYDSEDFSLLVPQTWQIVADSDIPAPADTTLELALSAQDERRDYVNNVIVLSTPGNIESSLNNSSHYLNAKPENYSLLTERKTSFLDEKDPADILIFRGKYNPDNPEITYIQTKRVCKDKTFFLTISVGEYLQSYERYEYILRSFRCQ